MHTILIFGIIPKYLRFDTFSNDLLCVCFDHSVYEMLTYTEHIIGLPCMQS